MSNNNTEMTVKGAENTGVGFANVDGLALLQEVMAEDCAGLGAFFYDLTNPLYAAEAPITFCLKFVIGLLAGLISHLKGHRADKFALNLTGALMGSFAYVALYLLKSYINEYFFLRNPIETVIAKLALKAPTSSINAVIAVIFAMILCPIFIKAMKSAGIWSKLYPAKSHENSTL